MKAILAPVFLFLFLVPAILFAGTIHVPGDEPTIQDAMDIASDGDTVLVADGTWDGATIQNLAITIRSENGWQHCTINHNSRGLEVFGAGVTIDGFTITGDGYGIEILASPASITNCLITSNSQGGIAIRYADTTISNCEISYNINDHQFGGGGIHAWADFTVDNCLFHHNAAWADNPGVHGQGGAIWCTFSSSTITNCTFHSNYATNVGGALASSQDHAPTDGKRTRDRGDDVMIVENCILWGNEATVGAKEVFSWDTTMEIGYSTIEGGQDSINGYYTWGDGMIEDDPLIATGTLGDYFLSQTAAGQAVDSPCVDTGNPATPLLGRTTRTDFVLDSGVIDMGWHYGEPPPKPEVPFLVAGTGNGNHNPSWVRVFAPEQGATHSVEFRAFTTGYRGVNIATGDVDGAGTSEIIAGAGPDWQLGPQVRGFTPHGETIGGLDFLAYNTNHWGVNVTCGDLDNNGRDEIITGASPNGFFGPHVRAFSWSGVSVSPVPGVSYFAYGTPKFGVNVAAGDIDGDGFDEIVTGPGAGPIYGPHVRGWNVDGGAATAIPQVNYMAYGTFRRGVRVSCGDVDGDGIDEIVTAPGPSPVFGAHIRGWNFDGGTLAEIPGINFFAWPATESLYGATVSAGTDLNNDGRDEIIAGAGPDRDIGTFVRVYRYNGSTTELLFELDAFGDRHLDRGVNTAAGWY